MAVTVFIKAMVVNMSDYVFHSRQAKDQSTIEDIQSCIPVWSKPQDEFAASDGRLKNPLLVDHGSQPSYEAGEK